jgi:hypothetical protein
VTHAAVAAHNTTDELTRAIADSAIIGLFFLLRPGEHKHSYTDNHPFRLQDVSFFCASVWHNTATTADLQLLQNATQVLLNFTTKKMARKRNRSPWPYRFRPPFPISQSSVVTSCPPSLLEGRPNHSTAHSPHFGY